MRLIMSVLLALFLGLGAQAEAAKSKKSSKAKAPAGPSLYEKIGGDKGLNKFMGLFLKRLTTDIRTKEYFAESDLEEVAARLTEFVCSALGGPCEYKGRSMKEAHHGMLVTNAAFDTLLEQAHFSLREAGAKGADIITIIKALNGMRKDIVTVK